MRVPELVMEEQFEFGDLFIDMCRQVYEVKMLVSTFGETLYLDVLQMTVLVE